MPIPYLCFSFYESAISIDILSVSNMFSLQFLLSVLFLFLSCCPFLSITSLQVSITPGSPKPCGTLYKNMNNGNFGFMSGDDDLSPDLALGSVFRLFYLC